MNTNTTKTIHVDFFDEDLEEKFTGTFTIKRHTIKDTSSINVRKVQLNAGLHVGDNGRGIDSDGDGLNFMIATLEVSIVTAPKWFNIDDLYSMNLMAHLYQEVMAFQRTFRPGRKSGGVVRTEGTESQEGSGQKNPEPNGPTAPRAVVSGEVSFELEP